MNEGYKRHRTVGVRVGSVRMGGGAPVVVQSMTNTDTADVKSTADQIIDLYQAGSEIVRFTVKDDAGAQATPLIRKEIEDRGFRIPLVGDFHYNGDKLLTKYPKLCESLDKFRINPGNVGFGEAHDPNFEIMVKKAIEYDKPVRIGVNGGSLDQRVLTKLMDDNSKSAGPKSAEEVFLDAMVESAVQSVNKALELGLPQNKIIVSAKVSDVQHLIHVMRGLAQRTPTALHLGLTEAGLGSKGIVAASMGIGIMLNEGIGDTIRVSITPKPGESRTTEVIVCQQILQCLGVRAFTPLITSCPGCGRTTSTVFQEIGVETEKFLRERAPVWKSKGFAGFESMRVAVMGCIVNGPGEAKDANIGISLPGTGEQPTAPVYADGKQLVTLKGDAKTLSAEFQKLIDDYVEKHYAPKTTANVS